MGIRFENLDTVTRALMTSEIDDDVRSKSLYLSNYLNAEGLELWPILLRQAAENGSDDTLSKSLNTNNCIKYHVERRKPKGGYSMVAVPFTASQTLSESQFNMYYMRALSLRALSDDRTLIVYRGKMVEKPRPESEQLIGTELPPEEVLRALRETKGVNPGIGIPLPGSGLTVRLS